MNREELEAYILAQYSTEPRETIELLLDVSYEATKPKLRRKVKPCSYSR